MKAVLIDDEQKARMLLHTILDEYCEEIDEVAMAPNLTEGVALIREKQPDIVFLDIEMPDYLGTQIIDFFEPEEMRFSIIFTTAHANYAIKAFEMNAVDYLLKPLRPKQVREAVQRAEAQQKQNNLAEQLSQLQGALSTQEFKKIGLPVADGILFVEIQEIIAIEADGMYTKVYTQNDGQQTISKPLKYFIDLLEDVPNFYRPHRSFFINLRFVKQFVRRDGNYILMDNDVIVSISRDKRDEFLDVLSGL